MQKTAPSAWVSKAGTFLAFGSLLGQSAPALANSWAAPSSVSMHPLAHAATGTSTAATPAFGTLIHSHGAGTALGLQSTANLLSAQSQAGVLASLTHHLTSTGATAAHKPAWQMSNTAAFSAPVRTGSLFNASLPTGVAGPGLQLDLTSSNSNIVLGSSLFNGATSATIAVGGKAMTFTAGSSVTPAEYIAVRQILAGGAQTLTVNASGAATGGNFRLDAAAGAQVGEIVVPKNVVALDFANSANNPIVTGDIVNYGTIYALTGRGSSANVSINAQDILNEHGATITTNLSAAMVRALGGVFTGSGLTLTADDTIANAGTISSQGNIALSSGTGSFINSGLIASSAGNINLSSANAASAINVNAAGGTFSAAKGDINVRDASYSGAGNVSLMGGDYLSRNLNIYAGSGTVDGNVGQLTGTLNTVAGVDHLQAATNNLILGNNTVSGDPTFVNTNGDIEIDGKNVFSEDVAIIASGNINANGSGQIITNGNAITLVAGAGAISTTSGDSPTVGGSGSTTATGNVSFTVPAVGSTASSGNINLSTSTAPNVLDSSSTTSSGGNITLVAFNGSIQTAATSSINAQGAGSSSGGSVSVIAPVGVSLGSVNTGGGSAGGTGGAILISASQAQAVTGNQITFDTHGRITTGTGFSATAPLDANFLESNISVGGSLNTVAPPQTTVTAGTAGANAGAITLQASGNITTGSLLAYGSGGAGGDATTQTGGAGGKGANVQVNTIDGVIVVNGDINTSGGGGGGAGTNGTAIGTGGAGGTAGAIDVAIIPTNSTSNGSTFNITISGNAYASSGGAGGGSTTALAGSGGASNGAAGGNGGGSTSVATNGGAIPTTAGSGGNVLISTPASFIASDGSTGSGAGLVSLGGVVTGNKVEIDSPQGLTINGNYEASTSLTLTASAVQIKQISTGLNIDTPTLTITSTASATANPPQVLNGVGYQGIPLVTDAGAINLDGRIADVIVSDNAANLTVTVGTGLTNYSGVLLFSIAMTRPQANLTLSGSLPASLNALSLTTDSTSSGGTITLPSNTSITTGSGGTVTLQANNINAPGKFSVNVDSSSSNGGAISITTNNLNGNPDFTVGNAAGQIALSARGINLDSTHIGAAGSITLIAPNSNVTLATSGFDVSYANIGTAPAAQAFSGNGGSITLNVKTLQSSSPILLNADGYGSGNGGKIALILNSTATQTIGSGNGQFLFSAQNGMTAPSGNAFGGSVSFTTAGALVVDSTAWGTSTVAHDTGGGVNGGTLTLSASQITSSSGGLLSISNNGFGQGFGGKIIVTETGAFDAKLGNTSADNFYFVAQGGGNTGANGAVSFSTGGNIFLTTDGAGNVNGQNDSVWIGAAGANGGGGSLSLAGNTIQNMTTQNAGMIFNAAGAGTGFGGTIKLTVNDNQSIDIGKDLSAGQLQFNVANGAMGVAAGSVSVIIGSLNDTTGTGVLTIDPAAITEQDVSKTNANVSGGGLVFVAPIIATASTVSTKTALILNASGAGTASGGNITYAETAPKSTVTIGTKPTQVELLASAGKSGSGGTILADSGGNLIVNVGGLSVKAAGATGNGGRVSLAAVNANDDANYGNLQVIGTLSVNAGSAKGQGGTINLSSNSPDNAFNIGLTKNNLNGVEGGLSASGISSRSGQGGNIVVTTSGSKGIVVQKSITAAEFFQFNYAAGATGDFDLDATIGSTKTSQILIAPTDNQPGMASNIIANKAGKLVVAMAAVGSTPAGNIILSAAGNIEGPTVVKGASTTNYLNIVSPELTATTTNGDIDINGAISAKSMLTIDTVSAGGTGNVNLFSAGGLTTQGFLPPVQTNAQENQKLLATPNLAVAGGGGSGSIGAGGDVSLGAKSQLSGNVGNTTALQILTTKILVKIDADLALSVFAIPVNGKTGQFMQFSGGSGPVGGGPSPQIKSNAIVEAGTSGGTPILSSFVLGGDGKGSLSVDCSNSLVVTGTGFAGITDLTVSSSAPGGSVSGPGILEARTVTVQTFGGNIGTAGAPLQINAPVITVNTFTGNPTPAGNAFINSLSTGTVTVTSSQAGGYNLTTAGAAKIAGVTTGDGGISITSAKTLTVDTLTSSGPVMVVGGGTTTIGTITTTGTTGDITLETTTGVLQTSLNAKVQAVNAGITFENLNASKGSIVVAAGSNIETGDGSTGVGGDVIFTIGDVAKVPGTAPTKNVTVTPDSGTVYFGTNGITANASKGIGNTLDAKAADIIFNTGTLKASAIKLNGNTTITADPPTTQNAASQTSQTIQSTSQRSSSSTPNDLDVSKAETLIPETRTLIQTSQASQPLTGGVSKQALSNTLTQTIQPSVINTQSVQINEATPAKAPVDNDARWISESEIESGLIPANLITDGKFALPSEVSSVFDYESTSHDLKRGSAVFAPQHDTVVKTPYGPLAIAAKSVVLVICLQDSLAVYNFNDAHKGSVNLSTCGEKIVIAPGKHLTVSAKKTHTFEELNAAQAVAYRSLRNRSLQDAGRTLQIFTADFNHCQAIGIVLPLRKLIKSDDKIAREIGQRLLKTSAILIQLNAGGEAYRQMPRPSVIASR